MYRSWYTAFQSLPVVCHLYGSLDARGQSSLLQGGQVQSRNKYRSLLATSKLEPVVAQRSAGPQTAPGIKIQQLGQEIRKQLFLLWSDVPVTVSASPFGRHVPKTWSQHFLQRSRTIRDGRVDDPFHIHMCRFCRGHSTA